jgi:hypothetical protein
MYYQREDTDCTELFFAHRLLKLDERRRIKHRNHRILEIWGLVFL